MSIRRVASSLLFLFPALAWAGKEEVVIDQPLPSGASVAVVQYTVDALNVNKHTDKMDALAVDASMDTQLTLLVRSLGESGLFSSVIPYSDFAGDDAYREGSQPLYSGKRKKKKVVDVCHGKYFCPGDPMEMPVFSDDQDLQIPAEQVAKTAAATGADLVLYLWGEYRLKAGFQKTASYWGTFALYDAQGQRQSFVTVKGEQDAGMFPAGDEAVQCWTDASERAFVEYTERLSQ